MTTSHEVRFVDRPGGRIAYEERGDGPLVVLAPGMGDLRSSLRELVGPLVDAGYRVATTDVRGHGDSDPFDEVGDAATASDLLALTKHLGAPAVLVGNSFAGSAAVIAAADRPDLVEGLVLLAPFLHGPAPFGLRLQHALLAAMFARPWGVAMWTRYYVRTLNRGRTAPWLAEHVEAIRASLGRPGRLAQFRRLAMRLDHRVVAPKVAGVRAPALVVVGALDPDYRDPAGELMRMGQALGARTMLVPEAAHYPHAQRPDLVVPEVVRFVAALPHGRRA